jgi:hypothetical protein
VGVLIDHFNRMRAESVDNRSLFMTTEQHQWIDMQQAMARMRPVRKLRVPTHPVRVFCYEMATGKPARDPPQRRGSEPSESAPVKSPAERASERRAAVLHRIFNVSVVGFIVLNTMCMCIQHFGESDEFRNAIEMVNTVCAVLFNVEAAIKIVALGWSAYYSDAWNRFDFLLVFATDAGTIWMTALNSQSSASSAITVARAMRIMRVLRLVKSATGLRATTNTLLMALPAMCNVVGLLFLMYFVYAVVGMQLFGRSHVGMACVLTLHVGLACVLTALNGAGRVAERAIPADGFSNASFDPSNASVPLGKTTLIYGDNSAIDDHANFTTLWNALALLVSSCLR